MANLDCQCDWLWRHTMIWVWSSWSHWVGTQEAERNGCGYIWHFFLFLISLSFHSIQDPSPRHTCCPHSGWLFPSQFIISEDSLTGMSRSVSPRWFRVQSIRPPAHTHTYVCTCTYIKYVYTEIHICIHRKTHAHTYTQRKNLNSIKLVLNDEIKHVGTGDVKAGRKNRQKVIMVAELLYTLEAWRNRN